MDLFPALRDQTQKKILCDLKRMNNKQNKTRADAKLFKDFPSAHLSSKDVRKANHQPVSSMKLTQTPYSTSGPRSIKNNLQPCQKGVVQRLFEDPDEEQDTSGLNKEPRTQTEQLQVKACSNNNPCDEKLEACDNEEEEDRTSLALPRESVIFFSTGKKFFRAPRPENREVSAQQDQPGPVSPDQTNLPAAPKETSAESEPGLSTNSSVLHLHREFIPEKAFHLHPAVAMLRKRLPLLEELRLDEEVSTYTAVSVPAAFLPPLPRCGNPLASILHFEESTRFVPISFDLSSGPSQLQSSRLHER
uniref:Uncharacterized protein n=1 Tax=Iconisemion striatum TaxID=60296 RepID=A0A1A7YDQ6_9TELE